MATKAPATRRLAVCRDLRTIREILQRIRQSDRLAPFNLFGRRSPVRMLDYLERRAMDRQSVQIPIYVTAAQFDGRYAELLAFDNAEFLAITRDVSLRGIGFTHDEPFDADYAIVTLDVFDAQSVSLLLEIRWSNLEQRCSEYMSGGRFVGITQTPG